MSRLINNLEKRMKRMGMTQKSLAVDAHLNETAVRDILKGRSQDPQLSTLLALSRVLKCSIEELTGIRGGYGLADGKTPWPAEVGKKAEDAAPGESPDTLYVEELDMARATGPVSLLDGRSRKVAAAWQVPDDVTGAPFKGKARDLALVRIEDDAMAPDFMPGDRVMINTTDVKPSPPGLFLLWDGDGFILRRCDVRPNTKPPRLSLSARNPAIAAREVALKEVALCGRVVGHWRKI